MNEQAIDPCSADIDWGVTNPPRTPRCLLLRGSEGNDATDVHQVAFLLGRSLGAIRGRRELRIEGGHAAIAVIIIHEPWLIFQQASCMSQVNIPGWDICHHTQSILGDDYYTRHCARQAPPWCPPSIGIIRHHPNLPHCRARRCPSYFLIWKALHFVCSTKSGTIHTSSAFPHSFPTVI